MDPNDSESGHPTSRRFLRIEPPKNGSSWMVYFCIATYSLLILASWIILLTFIRLLFTSYWPIPFLYYAYALLDKKTTRTGGRRIDCIYKSKYWSHLAAYFPVNLLYSSNFKLDPKENYLVNYHPHGISAFGCVSCFATNGLNLSGLFPGITARFMVHDVWFFTPILRELFLHRGDCSVDSKSIDHILSQKATHGKAGNLLTLISGGLAEADLSDPRVLRLVIKRRKGFVKKALIHGANLIPCIAFGENSVYKRVEFHPSSFMYKLQQSWNNLVGFKCPAYYGRSVLSKRLRGLIPYRRPITVVMGEPIMVKRVESPPEEQVERLHSEYIRCLERLYESQKDLCDEYDTRLELV